MPSTAEPAIRKLGRMKSPYASEFASRAHEDQDTMSAPPQRLRLRCLRRRLLGGESPQSRSLEDKSQQFSMPSKRCSASRQLAAVTKADDSKRRRLDSEWMSILLSHSCLSRQDFYCRCLQAKELTCISETEKTVYRPELKCRARLCGHARVVVQMQESPGSEAELLQVGRVLDAAASKAPAHQNCIQEGLVRELKHLKLKAAGTAQQVPEQEADQLP